MREGLPSVTALVVAGARAASGVDPFAERLVPPLAGSLFQAIRSSRAARVLSLGLVEHLELRTRAIDAAIAAAGSPELVILGAGLDARAHRLEVLREATVFEVDHPSTQAFKQRRASVLPRAAREIRYVAVDFERDSLDERLARAGHDRSAPTTWVWEGVTQYLTLSAIEATLDVVAARSSAGSVLVMTYGTPELGTMLRSLRPLVLPTFRALGEALRGLMTKDQAHSLVRARRFGIASDDQVSELAPRHGRAPLIAITERVLVARIL